MLKQLCLYGFRRIHVVDRDTVDITNLHRQWLYTADNVGASKALTAVAALRKWVAGRVDGNRSDMGQPDPTFEFVAHDVDLMALSSDFFGQFDVICSALDNIEARRHVSALLVKRVRRVLVDVARPGVYAVDRTSVIPMVDGGTEAFVASVRVIFPGLTACVECALDLYPASVDRSRATRPVCTVAGRPHTLEDCVTYGMMQWDDVVASSIAVPRAVGGEDMAEIVDQSAAAESMDPRSLTSERLDCLDAIEYVLRVARERAASFGIAGIVERSLVVSMMDHVIPALPSVNAYVGVRFFCVDHGVHYRQ